jgi:hypothetical protein
MSDNPPIDGDSIVRTEWSRANAVLSRHPVGADKVGIAGAAVTSIARKKPPAVRVAVRHRVSGTNRRARRA